MHNHKIARNQSEVEDSPCNRNVAISFCPSICGTILGIVVILAFTIPIVLSLRAFRTRALSLLPIHIASNRDSWGISKVINLGDQVFDCVHSHSALVGVVATRTRVCGIELESLGHSDAVCMRLASFVEMCGGNTKDLCAEVLVGVGE